MNTRKWFKANVNSNEGQNREIINLKKEQNIQAIREHKEKLYNTKKEIVTETRIQSNDCNSIKHKISKD